VADEDDLFAGDSPKPSEEGMPPARYAPPAVDLGAPRPVSCPPCTRYGCPARRWPHGRPDPWLPPVLESLRLEWENPLRGTEMRNQLSRWVLTGTLAAATLVWCWLIFGGWLWA